MSLIRHAGFTVTVRAGGGIQANELDQHSQSVAGGTRLSDPCQTCRESDRQQARAVVLSFDVADAILQSIGPSLARRISPCPATRPGPRLLRRNPSGPVLRAGPDSRNKTRASLQGPTRRGTKIACGCPHRVEFARGRYMAPPIKHSLGPRSGPSVGKCCQKCYSLDVRLK